MASTQTPEIKEQPITKGQQRRRRLPLLLLAFVLISVLIGWQLVSTQSNNTDPAVAGRPLSNSQTHLHTVELGGKPGQLYLGTHFGLFTSNDGGHTWPQTRGMLNNLMITAIAVSPGNADSLAVVGIPSTSSGSPFGIYFSKDGGQNWLLQKPLICQRQHIHLQFLLVHLIKTIFMPSISMLDGSRHKTWERVGDLFQQIPSQIRKHNPCLLFPIILTTCYWEEIRGCSKVRIMGNTGARSLLCRVPSRASLLQSINHRRFFVLPIRDSIDGRMIVHKSLY